MNIIRNLIVAVLMTVVTTLLLGVLYPLAITGLAQVAVPRPGERPARGARMVRVVGSRLIGQGFSKPGYFHSRPSATSTPYDAANSGGQQLRPDQQEADRRREGQRRGRARGEPVGTGARGSGHDIRVRLRPSHLACRGRLPGAARRA